jgi:hypothetical protein
MRQKTLEYARFSSAVSGGRGSAVAEGAPAWRIGVMTGESACSLDE